MIVETKHGNPFSPKKEILTKNLDPFAYVNSKFVYVEKHFKRQLLDLYRSIVSQRCELEQQVLKNTLTLAHIRPDLFAYALMKGPGYISVVAGEVAHVIKCVPVEVTRKATEQCYLELPVQINNATRYLMPKTRVIVSTGTQIPCNPLLPTLFHVKGGWVSLTPAPSAVPAPNVLEPMHPPHWQYTDAEHLATSGIYTSNDLDRLKEHIMFPVERPTVVDNIVRAATGQRVPLNGISLNNLLDEASIETIASSAMDRLWGGFLKFGTATAGIIGVFLIIKAIKAIIDILIHGYALHTIYGWSIHLIGAFFSSVTHLLMHLGTRPRPHKSLDATPKHTTNAVVTAQPRSTTRHAVPQVPRPAQSRINNVELQESPSPIYPQLAAEINALTTSMDSLEQRLNRCGSRDALDLV